MNKYKFFKSKGGLSNFSSGHGPHCPLLVLNLCGYIPFSPLGPEFDPLLGISIVMGVQSRADEVYFLVEVCQGWT